MIRDLKGGFTMAVLTEEQSKSNKTLLKKPELLAPAGNLEKLKVAVHYLSLIHI